MSDTPSGLFLGQSDANAPENLLLNRANRHGVVAGATGTGKTVTLQIMAQGFSDAGVPVFCADVKGDLSGISQPGAPNDKLIARAADMGLTLTPRAAPTVFWDLYGQKGHPIRATVNSIGPALMARMLDLNEVQEGVLTVAFHVAKTEDLPLLDMADLRSLLAYVGENAARIGREIGAVAPSSLAAIQRSLLQLENEGGSALFGEPELNIQTDMIRVDANNRGQVNVLDATKLMNNPRLYGAFLLWLLSELFEKLPEIGDPDKPVLVFFFDEAHLLFRDSPKSLLEKIEQLVRLIRSKGIGVYFVTQNPADIPPTVLGQLGNRIQHALRAYTPSEQRGLKTASESFRANPASDTAQAIQELGVGEALVSLLDEKGVPTVVARTKIRPPDSRLGPVTDAERRDIMAASPVSSLYGVTENHESASEILTARRAAADQASAQAKVDAEAAKAAEAQAKLDAKAAQAQAREEARSAARANVPVKRASTRQTPLEAMTTSVLRTAGNTLTRELLRTVMKSLKRR